MNTGVYKIQNIINGKFYIGSTTWGFKKRWKSHLNLLRKNQHQNPHLQYSWNKHGEKNFKFEIIEPCDKSICIIREQHYIDNLHPQYNILQFAGSALGHKHTPATKLIIGLASAGKNNAAYSGEYIYYNPKYGFFTGGIVEFCKNHKLPKMSGYNLVRSVVNKSHGWIYIGKIGDKLPENINDYYYNKIHNNKEIYSFYHKEKGTFTGTIPDFINFNNINKLSRSVIYSLSKQKRKMAWGWIFLCKGKNIPTNIDILYNNALLQNSKANSKMNNIYTFIKNDNMFTGTISSFVKNYNLNDVCVRRLASGGRKQYCGWIIKT